jgi:hypothetical protein
MERALLHVEPVQVRDLKFAARRGAKRPGFLDHGAVIEVQPGDGLVALGFGGLFLQGHGPAV